MFRFLEVGKRKHLTGSKPGKIPEELSKDFALSISQLLTKDTQSPVGVSDCPGG